MYLKLIQDEIDHLVIVAHIVVDVAAHIRKGFIEYSEEHVYEHIGYRHSVAEEEKRTQHRTVQLHRKEVKSAQHHLK